MKKLLSIILSIIMLLSIFTVVPTANAKDKEYKSNNCIYEINKSGNAIIKDCYNENINSKYSYWKIPSYIDGHKVVGISFTTPNTLSEKLFDISKVRVPETVTSINKNFCKSLFKVYIDQGTNYPEIVCNANSFAKKYAIKNQLKCKIIESNKVYGPISLAKKYNSKGEMVKSNLKISKYYNGKSHSPKVTLKNNGNVLRKGKDYTLQYIDNCQVGEATILIIGKGNYSGFTFCHFNINPEKQKIYNLKKENNESVRVCFKYTYDLYKGKIIEYSTKKDFSTGQCVKITDESDSYVIKNLSKDKKYYFRIRNYHNVRKTVPVLVKANGSFEVTDFGIMKLCGKWSDVKFIRV